MEIKMAKILMAINESCVTSAEFPISKLWMSRIAKKKDFKENFQQHTQFLFGHINGQDTKN